MIETKPFKIRNVEINPPLVLSPMAGVTDISFRRLLKARGGIGLTVSEFISVEGLTRKTPKSKAKCGFNKNGGPLRCRFSVVNPSACGWRQRWPKKSAQIFWMLTADVPRPRWSSMAVAQDCC